MRVTDLRRVLPQAISSARPYTSAPPARPPPPLSSCHRRQPFLGCLGIVAWLVLHEELTRPHRRRSSTATDDNLIAGGVCVVAVVAKDTN
jgi:hypothetical protein